MKIDVSFLKMEMDTLEAGEENLEELVSHSVVKAFLRHEKVLGRNHDKKVIKESLCMFLEPQYEDIYGLRRLILRKDKLRDLVSEVEKNEASILSAVEERINRYMTAKWSKKFTIYLYGLGNDGGFSLNNRVAYINILECMDNLEDILAHEVFHSRKGSGFRGIKRLLLNLLPINSKTYRLKILQYIKEEGSATLIEHNGKAPEDVEEIRHEYDELNKLIYRCKKREVSYKEVMKYFVEHNLQYRVGWLKAYEIFQKEGKKGLDSWLLN